MKMTTRINENLYATSYDESDPTTSFRAAARAALTEIVAANGLTGHLRLNHCAKMPGEKAIDSATYSLNLNSNRMEDAVFDLYYRHFSGYDLNHEPGSLPEFVHATLAAKDDPVQILFLPQSSQNPERNPQ